MLQSSNSDITSVSTQIFAERRLLDVESSKKTLAISGCRCFFIAVAGLAVWLSDPFQQCMKESHYESSDFEPAKSASQTIITLKVCTGRFLKEDSEAVTAFFTLVIGLFTFALWQSTERLWQASEKDFISSNRPKLIVREVLRFPPPTPDKISDFATSSQISAAAMLRLSKAM
jgi:hypothetical protein